MLNSCTLKESRMWLLICTRHRYFIPFNHEHPVGKYLMLDRYINFANNRLMFPDLWR